MQVDAITFSGAPLENAKGLPKRLEMLMDEQRLDASDVASRLDVHETTVYRWLEGGSAPYKKNLRLLADAYGYNYTWLAKGKGPKLVEREDIPPNAAIIFYDAETQEVWATAELALRVTVHKPMKIIGGKRGGGLRIDVDAE